MIKCKSIPYNVKIGEFFEGQISRKVTEILQHDDSLWAFVELIAVRSPIEFVVSICVLKRYVIGNSGFAVNELIHGTEVGISCHRLRIEGKYITTMSTIFCHKALLI